MGGEDDKELPPTSSAASHAVTVKLPPFWPQQPRVWFAQAEAQFELKGITQEGTRYCHLVSALDQEVAARVVDFLTAPPTSARYSLLKDRLLSTFSLSESERASRLLHLPAVGDERPSVLMDRMLSLLGSHPPCFLFRQLFLERLPEDVRPHLLRLDSSDCRQMALVADQLCQARLQALASCRVDQPVSEEPVCAAANGRVRASSTSDQRLCRFHYKFGKKAKKCESHCKYWPGNFEAGRQ